MKNVICDIDGVLLHKNDLIPGADKLIHSLLEKGIPLTILTNYPSQTAADLQNRLNSAGINVPENCLYTSAMATAAFLERQEGRKAWPLQHF
jgi:NagD protein